MTNTEAHHELNDLLTKVIAKQSNAPTNKEKEPYYATIEALRHACKVLRNSVDLSEVEQTSLF